MKRALAVFGGAVGKRSAFLALSLLLHAAAALLSWYLLGGSSGDETAGRVLEVVLAHEPAEPMDLASGQMIASNGGASGVPEQTVVGRVEPRPRKQGRAPVSIPAPAGNVQPQGVTEHEGMIDPDGSGQAPVPAESHEDKPPLKSLLKIPYSVAMQSVDAPWLEEEPEPGDVEGMLQKYAQDLAASKAAKSGNFDPELLDFRDQIEQEWKPGFDQISGHPLKEAPAKWMAGWKKSAQLYGETGSPVEVDGTSGVQSHGDLVAPGVLDVNEQLQESGVLTKRVALAVTIWFDGKGGWQIGEVEPSGQAQFDDAALDAIEKALSAKGSKIPAKKMKTKWAMEADFTVIPPLPVAGISFDLALGYFEVLYPLKKKVKHRLVLLAVQPTKSKGEKGEGGK